MISVKRYRKTPNPARPPPPNPRRCLFINPQRNWPNDESVEGNGYILRYRNNFFFHQFTCSPDAVFFRLVVWLKSRSLLLSRADSIQANEVEMDKEDYLGLRIRFILDQNEKVNFEERLDRVKKNYWDLNICMYSNNI